MKDIGTQMRDEFFKTRFNELYEGRWKSKGKTQQDFADAIRAQFNNPDTCKCDNNLVSKWLNGKTYPTMYLPQIAKVLGVEEEEFTPSSHDDRYKYDPEFMAGVLSKNDKYAKSIKLRPSFMKYVRTLNLMGITRMHEKIYTDLEFFVAGINSVLKKEQKNKGPDSYPVLVL